MVAVIYLSSLNLLILKESIKIIKKKIIRVLLDKLYCNKIKYKKLRRIIKLINKNHIILVYVYI